MGLMFPDPLWITSSPGNHFTLSWHRADPQSKNNKVLQLESHTQAQKAIGFVVTQTLPKEKMKLCLDQRYPSTCMTLIPRINLSFQTS